MSEETATMSEETATVSEKTEEKKEKKLTKAEQAIVNKEKAKVSIKEGQECMKSDPPDYDKAARCFTRAGQLDPDNHLIYLQRGQAHEAAGRIEKAEKDAERTLFRKKDFAPAFLLKGRMLYIQQQYPDAEEAFTEGLQCEPDNEDLQWWEKEAKTKQEELLHPFKTRKMMKFLSEHEKTREFMKDPEFVQKMEKLRENEDSLIDYMQDRRVLMAMAVLLEVDIPTEVLIDPNDPLVQPSNPNDTDLPDLTGEDSPSSQDEEEEEEPSPQGPLTDGQKQALEEKERGNAAYKQKNFASALQHYSRAVELDPTNITFLTNKAAVYFEQKEWDTCLKVCEEAVEKGRECRADYKHIAKALARMGNVYYKLEKWEDAVKYYDKSIAEHRNPDVVTKKNDAKRKWDEQKRLAYIDPEKSLEAKQKGNECFKRGEYPAAIKHYDEAIKRNPDDAKIYSNRAACYTKLMEFSLAVKDCDRCTRLDPKFIKGHIRKGTAYLGLKDTVRAMQAFQDALDLNPENEEAKSGLRRCVENDDPEDRRKRAMQDPEVQEILRDPAMQLILQQMQSNPQALRDHLSNPDIAAKIQKLMEAGFISIR